MLLADARREHAAAHDREARAHGVAHDAPGDDAVRVLRRRERDRRDLRPVAPLRQEGERERLREHAERLALAVAGPGGARRRGAARLGVAGRVLLLARAHAQLLLDLLELLGHGPRLHAPRVPQQPQPEVEEEARARVVRVGPRQEGRQREAQQRRQHRHHRERAERAGEDDEPRVAHRQDRRDEERLVADLRRPDHAHGVHERAREAGAARRRRVAGGGGASARRRGRGRRDRARPRPRHVEARQRGLELVGVQAGVVVRVAAAEGLQDVRV